MEEYDEDKSSQTESCCELVFQLDYNDDSDDLELFLIIDMLEINLNMYFTDKIDSANASYDDMTFGECGSTDSYDLSYEYQQRLIATFKDHLYQLYIYKNKIPIVNNLKFNQLIQYCEDHLVRYIINEMFINSISIDIGSTDQNNQSDQPLGVLLYDFTTYLDTTFAWHSNTHGIYFDYPYENESYSIILYILSSVIVHCFDDYKIHDLVYGSKVTPCNLYTPLPYALDRLHNPVLEFERWFQPGPYSHHGYTCRWVLRQSHIPLHIYTYPIIYPSLILMLIVIILS